MKCNQPRPGFELVSPCPFSTTITITPRSPHIQLAGRHILCCYVLFSHVCQHTHTHTHVSMILPPSLFFCLYGEHTYTHICSNNTHDYSAYICNIHTHTHTYIHAKHIQTLLLCINFSSFVLCYKNICFNILVVKFILSALFILFMLVIVKHVTRSFASNKTPKTNTILQIYAYVYSC